MVAHQIGRRPRAPVEVAARCHLGLPTVIRVPPVLDDGTPFPTLYWLTCPVTRRSASALESAGLVKVFQQRRDCDPAFSAACAAADRGYAAEREAVLAPQHRGRAPAGGVAGSRGGVKCLHAHLAHHLAGRDNPIGAEVSGEIGPPDCAVPCVPT